MEKDRARFVSTIIIDSLAPTNTLAGNPTAQKRLIDSGGLSLMKGLKNAYHDMVHNKGLVSQVDKRPFKLGENVATSKGAVVLRTEMMELIHYAPTTEQVYAVPQLTIPPQINKMYINDLSPEKSVVKYQLDGGIQTFVISWKNPSKDQGVWGMTDYVRSCRLAMDAVGAITGTNGQCLRRVFGGRPPRCGEPDGLGRQRANGALTLMAACFTRCSRTARRQPVSEHGLALPQAGEQAGSSKAATYRTFACCGQRSDLELRCQQLPWARTPPPSTCCSGMPTPPSLGLPDGDFLTLFETLAFTKKGEVEMAGHKIDLSKVTSTCSFWGGVTDHITPWSRPIARPSCSARNRDYVLSHRPYAGDPQSAGQSKAKYYVLQARKTPPTANEWLKATGNRQAAGGVLDGMVAPALRRERKHPPRLGTRNTRRWTPRPASTYGSLLTWRPACCFQERA